MPPLYPLPATIARRAMVCLLIALTAAAVTACSDTDPSPVRPSTDMGEIADEGSSDDEMGDDILDMDEEDPPDEGLPDMDTEDPPDADMPSPVDMEDMRPEDMEEDMNPGELTCPEDLRDSCIFETLSCVGGSTDIKACVFDPFIMRNEVEFRSGARGYYYDSAAKEFRTISADGVMCYRALAQSEGADPQAWSVQDGTSGLFYEVVLTDTEARFACADGSTEICSRAKFDLFFAWPDDFPANCPDKDPMGSCTFDTDCSSGELCCPAGANTPPQCTRDDFCLTQRQPVTCTDDADCGPGEECSLCNRSGSNGRECVPEGFADDINNGLGCAPDGCTPGNGTCADPRVCCLTGGTYQCSADFECDTAPDPNPVCQPSATQACTSPAQNCCYVSQLNEFRCIDRNAVCRQNVCFSDSDCPSNEQCCNANAAANTPGTCLSQCQTTLVSCSQDSDCTSTGNGNLCCKYPGYNVGSCVPTADDCIYFTCPTGPSECGPGETCCSAAPLTTPMCITGAQMCPPDPF